MRRPGVVVAALVTLALSGCGAPAPTSPPAPSATVVPLAAGEVALPTEPPIAVAPGVATACAGVGIDMVLHGDAADPQVVWLIGDIGPRVSVVWPTGYRARFDPSLEVLDANDTVVLRDGDRVTGACVVGDPKAILLLEPPFK